MQTDRKQCRHFPARVARYGLLVASGKGRDLTGGLALNPAIRYLLGKLEKGADQKPHGLAETGPFPLIQFFQMQLSTTNKGVIQNLDVRPDLSRLRRLAPGKSFRAPGRIRFFDQPAVVHSC